MKLRVNIEKIHLFLFAVMFVAMLGVVFVIAYNPSISGGNPAVMGHSSDEVMVNVFGEIKGLQEAIDDGNFSKGVESPACAFCVSCGGEWPLYMGRVDGAVSNQDTYAANCALPIGSQGAMAYLCCR
jgi:hypothetical protein